MSITTITPSIKALPSCTQDAMLSLERSNLLLTTVHTVASTVLQDAMLDPESSELLLTALDRVKATTLQDAHITQFDLPLTVERTDTVKKTVLAAVIAANAATRSASKTMMAAQAAMFAANKDKDGYPAASPEFIAARQKYVTAIDRYIAVSSLLKPFVPVYFQSPSVDPR